MRKTVLLLVVLGFTVSACGGWRDSRVNPGNWFGSGSEVPVATAEGEVNPLIPAKSVVSRDREEVDRHVLIETVSDLQIERTVGGAIILVTGVGRVQGAYGAELRPVSPDEKPVDGVLAYTFNVLYPSEPRAVGSERTRTVEVARSRTTQDLDGVRVIRITAASNARESRRR